MLTFAVYFPECYRKLKSLQPNHIRSASFTIPR